MACMFNKYFELANYINNSGESLAFKVAVITSSVAKMSFFVAEITLKCL